MLFGVLVEVLLVQCCWRCYRAIVGICFAIWGLCWCNLFFKRNPKWWFSFRVPVKTAKRSGTLKKRPTHLPRPSDAQLRGIPQYRPTSPPHFEYLDAIRKVGRKMEVELPKRFATRESIYHTCFAHNTSGARSMFPRMRCEHAGKE